MKIPVMSPDALLAYRGILNSKLEESIANNDKVKKEALERHIEAIDVMLSNSLYSTLEAYKDDIVIDPNMFNTVPLRLALGMSTDEFVPKGLTMSPAQPVGQTRISFQQGAEEAVIVSDELDEVEQKVMSDIKKELEKLLSKDFASNMFNAINLYRERVDSKLDPASAWFKITELVPKEHMYNGLYAHLANTVYQKNPLEAMLKLRKYLPYPPFELANLLQAICEKQCVSDFDREFMKHKFENHQNSYISNYVQNPEIIKLVQTNLRPDETSNINKIIAEYAMVVEPTKRESIRKTYIEKGYV